MTSLDRDHAGISTGVCQIKTLIVATSAASSTARADAASGATHRIDYLALADQLGAEVIDYGSLDEGSRVMRAVESKSRFDIRLARRANSIVRDGGFDTVVSMSERVGLPLGFILPSSVRHVVLGHHLFSRRKLQLLRQLRISRRWDDVVFLTRREAALATQQLGFTADRVHVAHTAVDTTFFTPQADTSKAVDDPDVVIAVGLANRDYVTLVEALRQTPDIPARLHVGSMWGTGSADTPVSDLPANVGIKGFVPLVELRDVYQNSRFVVVPIRSTTQWCSGSSTVLQAQAMGKPVIATRNPGMVDYVLDGQTGLLVDEGDVTAMAAAMTRLWNDPQLCDEMGRRAQAWAMEHFSLEQWLAGMTRILTGVQEPAQSEPATVVHAGS